MKPIDIVLLIRHPQMDPVNITRVLELEPTTSWKFGDQVKTPKGNLVPDIKKAYFLEPCFSDNGE